MKVTVIIFSTLFLSFSFIISNAQQCRFEKTNGKESATYFEAIDWFKQLDKISPLVVVKQMGGTDAGYPLHLVLVSSDAKFDVAGWHREKKVVILINNGIHPGEPDGIDASMMLVRDIAAKKIKLPGNVALAFIPVYNIGGTLNRGSSSRVNQNGPLEYGFRGNSQNLDLNRDFTKCDSKEARSFTEIFHFLDPDILMDNHVSDGADYQHTMTLLTTQYDKLGHGLGDWLKQIFEPQLYSSMSKKGWDMIPYANFETARPDVGMEMFYDPPRYSSGYAALFQTISFIPETHMLKPYKDRVLSTYALMQTMIEKTSANAGELLTKRANAKAEVIKENSFPLSWQVDSTKNSMVRLMGYEPAFKTSDVTGLQSMYYDHDKPFTKAVRYFDVFTPTQEIKKPTAYIIPQGWHAVIDLLKLNGVKLHPFLRDTLLTVEAYHIDDYKSIPRPYEKHHKNNGVKVSVINQPIQFLKGDVYIAMDQRANRYIIEMLEPTGDDSFFAWNFFDAILQQKEGYSDYRWEELASRVLKDDPALQKKFQAKRSGDAEFTSNASAQLDFIYKNSPYYEPVHLRYPVFRFIK
ncbi:MAG: M14 family metallopeptidase [Ferruginibacter sp.]|nr:M14 family metallopeptidase [Ferruginibacter sp.]